jgi:hypothetical protein
VAAQAACAAILNICLKGHVGILSGVLMVVIIGTICNIFLSNVQVQKFMYEECLKWLQDEASKRGIPKDITSKIISQLLREAVVYSPRDGFLKTT